MAEATVKLHFKWVSVSPDPHNVTMRNTLEPIHAVFIQVDIPLKHEYIANSEPIIKVQLDADLSDEPEPILTKEGMRYAIEQLSLEAIPESEVSEEEWDEGESEDTEDWGSGNDDDDNWDED